jgi:zinc transport system permease protein
MVVPVATSQQLARSFRATLLGAMAVGTVAALGGLVISAVLSFQASVAPGPTIVLLALAMFASTWPIGVWLRRRQRLLTPFPEVTVVPHTTTDEHPHAHGPDCGHPAVPHGDHLDYVHGGHRHAVHGEHYDEH